MQGGLLHRADVSPARRVAAAVHGAGPAESAGSPAREGCAAGARARARARVCAGVREYIAPLPRPPQVSAVGELQHVRALPGAYAACVAEVSRRRSFGRAYMAEAEACAERLARMRGEEVARRDRFNARFGCHLPRVRACVRLCVRACMDVQLLLSPSACVRVRAPIHWPDRCVGVRVLVGWVWWWWRQLS